MSDVVVPDSVRVTDAHNHSVTRHFEETRADRRGNLVARSVRNQELLRVFDALADPAATGKRLFDVTGEIGMGRTSFLAAVGEYAEDAGMAVVRGRCSERDGHEPLAPLIGSLDTPPSVVLGPLAGSPAATGTGPEARNDVYSAVRAALEGSGDSPVVVTLDDFHLADEWSIEFVETLARRRPDTSLFVLVARHTRRSPRPLQSALAHGIEFGTVERIDLAPLTLDQSAAILGRTVDDDLRTLHAESAGSPLYLLALAQRDRPGAAGMDARTSSHIDALLSDHLHTRNDAERAVLEAMAVLGGDAADAEQVGEVAGMDIPATCRAFTDLADRDVLRIDERSRSVGFGHPVLRRVAYEMLTLTKVGELHRRAFDVLAERMVPARVLAHHVERSLDRAAPGDGDVLVAASEDVLREDPGRAQRWLRIAIGLTPDPRRTAMLTLRLAQITAANGALAQSSRTAAEAARLVPADAPELATEIALHQALVHCLAGRTGDATETLDERMAQLPPDAHAQTVDLMVRYAVLSFVGGPAVPRDRVERLTSIAEEPGEHPTVRAGALALIGFAAALDGDPEYATTTLTECGILLDRIPESSMHGVPDRLVLLGYTEVLMGWFPNAERHLTGAIEAARATGASGLEPTILLTIGGVRECLGDLAGAAEHLREAERIAERSGSEAVRAYAAASGHLISLLTGETTDPSAAVAAAEQVVIGFRQESHAFAGGLVLWLRAALESGADTARCTKVLREGNGGPGLVDLPVAVRAPLHEMLVAAAVARGETDLAHEWLAQANAAAGDDDLPHHQAFVSLARGHLAAASDEHVAAQAFYDRAAELYSLGHMGFHAARALLFAGRSAAGAGNHRDAAARLDEALRNAEACGAVPLVREIRDRRDALEPPESASAAALSSLTKRESEVARIAGSGKRTREIADQLHMSPRTVDVHLTRIYRKLNLSSRGQLIRLLAES